MNANASLLATSENKLLFNTCLVALFNKDAVYYTTNIVRCCIVSRPNSKLLSLCEVTCFIVFFYTFLYYEFSRWEGVSFY